ncbi:hypothetical protein TVAG_483720 [Trichomonas vaginalis G3]|uniref:Uncharacterized protein n=1 Tax=Trichomonas vaginalis (strain ATCC PRA-98 / G3) TaxID=412133 RepID=A2EA16_TRIV3|nr:hypothetical protein TVAGG3_0981150 [Trichomonas vaginalis G3]EAY10462.1 hypothetical protein TVAG_483720 [Trichomonas vaginalis G3]KAI5489310.1 hypothetical protein TVAGG3_0981150 [Trichomonas vaginalis G3]|eukprot:XP_001322685.1 hypothetical protein [Trichomonas vaginalis G3]
MKKKEPEEIRSKKIRFRIELDNAHEQIIHRIMKLWADKLNEFAKRKSTIEQKYDINLARVNNIQANLQSKISIVKNQNKELLKKQDTLINEINKAKTACENRYDNTMDIEVEAKLKVQKEQLEQRQMNTLKDLQKAQSRRDFYFSKYTEFQTKISKKRQKESELKQITQLREERKILLDELKRKIDIEQGKLTDDLALLEQYRMEILGQTKSPRKKSRHSQSIVNSWKPNPETDKSEDENIESVNLYNDSIEEESEEEEANPDAKALEQQILTLLSTGVYDETDPIIVSLRKQLVSLKNQSN